MQTTSSLSRMLRKLAPLAAGLGLTSATFAASPGAIGIFTDTTGGEAVQPAGGNTLTHAFGAGAARSAAGIELNGGGDGVELNAGHYLVMYNSLFNSAGGGERREIQSKLSLAGTDLPVGRSQAYIRRQNGQDEAITTGAGIIQVASDGDLLQLQSLRTDNENNAVTRGNQTGLQVLKLNDAWDYLRLSRTADQAGPSGPGGIANAVEVTYDSIDESNANFGFTAGGSNITLTEGGKYLVVANTYLTTANSDSDRRAIAQRLTLDNAEITGSRTSVYIRGNPNGDSTHDGAASIATIIEATAGQELSIDVSQNPGTNSQGATAIKADATALTIVKLPDTVDYIRLTATAGTQNINDANAVTWGAQEETGAPTFSHTPGGSEVSVGSDGDFLFLTVLYTDDTDTGRGYPQSFFQVNNLTSPTYGRSGFYTRNASDNSGDGQLGGNFNAVMLRLNSGDGIELETNPLGSGGTIHLDRGALQGVSLSSLFPFEAVDDTGVTDEDTALTVVDPGSTSSLFRNDVAAAAFLVSADVASSAGGPVTVNGDGTFSYDPSGLFEGLNVGDMAFDTFDYTMTNADSTIVLLPASARFDSLTDDDDPNVGFGAGGPTAVQRAAGLTFRVTFTPAAGDLDSPTQAVNLIEIGGDANGTGLYLLGGELHFLSKMNGNGANFVATFNDLDFSSGNNMIGLKSSFGSLTAGTEYTVTVIFDPITNATLEIAVQPAGEAAALESYAVTGVGGETNWHGDNSASAFRGVNIANFGATVASFNGNTGNPFHENNINANTFEGTQGQALYWSEHTFFSTPGTDTATVTVKINGANDPPTLTGSGIPDQCIFTSSPTVDVNLFDYFEDVDNDDDEQIYTVTVISDGALIQTEAISSVDGVLTINTPCTLAGTADITVEVEDTGGLTVSDTFTVEVKDDVVPVLTGEKDVVANAPAKGSVMVTFPVVTALDKVDGVLPVTCSPDDTTAFTVGSHTVVCTATDTAGNVGMTTFQVHILPIQPPGGERVLDMLSLRNDPVSGGGLPGGATIFFHNRAYLNNAGDIIYEASLSNAGTNNNAVIKNVGGVESVVAVRNTVAAGGGNFGSFSNLAISEGGDTIFQSLVGGVGHFVENGGTVSNPARVGGAASGTTGVFGTIHKPAVSTSGQALSPTNLRLNVGGVSAADDTGVWRSGGGGAIVGREGGASPIVGTAYGHFHPRVVASDLNDQLAFTAFIVQPVFDASTNTALFAGPLAGPQAPVVFEGDAVPGEAGVTFGSFVGESVNSAGDVAFRCLARGTGIDSSNNEGIWTNAGGPLRAVAREGDVAPCLPTTDVAFGRFTTVFIGDDGAVCFYAYLRDAGMTAAVNSSNDGSIWRFDPISGTLHLVAREGDIANSTDGAVINLLGGFDCSSLEGVVFHATLKNGVGDVTSATNVGVWLDRGAPDVAPELVLRRGDKFTQGKTEFTVTNIILEAQSNAGGGTGGYGRVINDSGEILMRVSLNNNASGLFKIAMP